MLILKLALRNIFVHKRRSIIIFLMIAIVSCLTFLFLSFSDGQIENFRKGTSFIKQPAHIIAGNNELGDIFERPVAKESLYLLTISNYPFIRDELLKMNFIDMVYNNTTIIKGEIFCHNMKFKNFKFSAIEPGYDKHITSKIEIIEGQGIKTGEEKRILLNEICKNEMKLKPGETLTLIVTDLFGQAVVEDFTFNGYYKPHINSQELSFMTFIDMTGYSLISGYYPGEAFLLNIDLKKNYPIKKALDILNTWANEKNVPISFIDYYTIFKEEDQIYSFIRLILLTISYLVIFVVMFGIMNVVTVNLFDRKKEIGTYYCLGAEKNLLIIIYTLEILIINLIAVIGGILLALGFRGWFNSMEFTTDDPGIQLVLAGNKFVLGFNFESIIWITLGIIVLTIVTAITSMGHSLHVSPLAAIREIEE